MTSELHDGDYTVGTKSSDGRGIDGVWHVVRQHQGLDEPVRRSRRLGDSLRSAMLFYGLDDFVGKPGRSAHCRMRVQLVHPVPFGPDR